MPSTIELSDAEHATVLAALRCYQERGMGDPDNRSDAIHDIATNGGEVMSSLDAEDIDDLCERINFREGPVQQGYTPADDAHDAGYEAGIEAGEADEIGDLERNRDELIVALRALVADVEASMPPGPLTDDQRPFHESWTKATAVLDRLRKGE